MANKKKYSGFSLVELSVVLAVIGLTLSGALVIATKKTISDKIEETNYKLDMIEKAMDAYLIKNFRLPCVADPEQVQGDNDFGAEDNDPLVVADDGECQATNTFDNGGSVYMGAVPTIDLILPNEFLFDGWGRRFSYVIDARFAHSHDPEPPAGGGTLDGTNNSCNGGNSTGEKVCFKYQTSGSITILDATGNLANPRTDEAVYVIISHGMNGNGAWKNVGGLSPSRLPEAGTVAGNTGDDHERENSGDDDTVDGFDAVFVQRDEAVLFDDIVRYRTKRQIMKDANVIDDYDLCILAEEKSAICLGSSDATDCEAMADQITNWCLDM
jgi:prepilin-type N-terminal cleavage/methylation domain-containing protein